MPNCNFYATRQDHLPLLEWLFDEGTSNVFEISSAFGQPLKQFRSAAEVLAEFDRTYTTGVPWHTVHLLCHVLGSGPEFVPRRVALDPVMCNGATFRYAADGWGLVQLYLSAPSSVHGFRHSHTNHFKPPGADKWAQVRPEVAAPDTWDFKKIAAFSSRLNRQIRKRGVAKIGSSVLLPGALELWQAGTPFLPRINAPLVLL